jgi:hypothetical protein
MKKSWTLCLVLASFCSFGQGIPNSYFNQFETIPCPFDPSSTVQAYKDWVLYQTLDDHWDGPIDSSVCISLSASNPAQGIDLHTVELSKPVFARCKFTEANKVWLYPDFLFNVSASTYNPNNPIFLQGGPNCTDNMCSGMYIGIQVPDEAGSGTNIRWHKDIPISDTTITYFETCVPTERFQDNYLRELILKLKTVPSVTPADKLRLFFADLASLGQPNYISEVIAPEFTFVDTSYEMSVELAPTQPNPWNNEYLLLYTNPNTYPSFANPAYVEGRPNVNTPDPKTINLIVGEWLTFVPQPFAFLRGALVVGSDSIRHHLNLVNRGGDICMGGISDFVFDGGTRYIHAGGHVNMEGLNACMMFRNGGCFEVASGTTMQYGQDGRGILALRSGGRMQLDPGSTLLFDGTLWLQGIPTGQHPDPQFYLDLKPGTSLVFGENAGLLNAGSISSDVKLNVYMNGGMLDDSRLSPGERQLIRRIYPTPSKRFSENLQVLGNPVAGQFRLDYLSAGQEQVRLQVHDLQGRLVWSKSYGTAQGHNTLEGEFGAGVAGVYVATLSSRQGQASVKLVRVD